MDLHFKISKISSIAIKIFVDILIYYAHYYFIILLNEGIS